MSAYTTARIRLSTRVHVSAVLVLPDDLTKVQPLLLAFSMLVRST